jgi:hypothetical protein
MTICAGCEDCIFEVDKSIPFNIHEIHITVGTNNVDWFSDVCRKNSIKPILIEYEKRSDKSTMFDAMTSQSFTGTSHEALSEASRIAEILRSYDFYVKRIKIETTPANPIVQTTDGYFESHLAVKLHMNREVELREEIKWHKADTGVGMHVSRNAFKRDNDIQTIMITHRRYHNDYNAFMVELTQASDNLIHRGFDIDRTIVEYCWYDSNTKHDDDWLNP